MYGNWMPPHSETPLASRLLYLRLQVREAMSRLEVESTKWNTRKEVHDKKWPTDCIEKDIDIKNDKVMRDALAGVRFHAEMARTYSAVIQSEIDVDRIASERGSGS